MAIYILLVVLAVVMVLVGSSLRVVTQFERGVVFRFGRLRGQTRRPGLTMIAPMADRLHKVNMQIVTLPVPAQEGITRDNVTVKVDAVVYFRVFDPVRVVVDVQNYQAAIGQVAQASLRSIIGKSDLDDLLSNRERLNQGLELMIDSPAVDWGIHIDRVDIKDVALPESMKRSMSRQAEAERERRSRVITAEGELQASVKLAEAAEVMTGQPAALQLRLLQTVVEVAAEKNSTLVLPFPVELLRFLERVTPPAPVTGSAGAVAGESASTPGGAPGRADPEATGVTSGIATAVTGGPDQGGRPDRPRSDSAAESGGYAVDVAARVPAPAVPESR
ncbi:MAG: putative rane protease [Streptosporangiaceae bacterium]|jgi:regulator of protease activity HflC (stomatin/prohibitin superfamily)|nr:putative rane protease [Streptosporangiaceae bacterium]